MSDRNLSSEEIGKSGFKEAVCVDINKIYDCCRDKDCMVDLEVYLTCAGKSLVDRAINVKANTAEILWVFIDVEPVPFNRGFYTVDIKFFFKIKFDAFLGVGRPCEFEGLATFDKRVILFGSEGNARIFSSKFVPQGNDIQKKVKTNMPEAVVEVVDPIVLDSKIVERCHCNCCHCQKPEVVASLFDDEILDNDDSDKVLLVTLGVFSIVRLERKVQLLMPAFDFCIPKKECEDTSDDPCSVFDKLNFPTDEFFPPQKKDFEGVVDRRECWEKDKDCREGNRGDRDRDCKGDRGR